MWRWSAATKLSSSWRHYFDESIFKLYHHKRIKKKTGRTKKRVSCPARKKRTQSYLVLLLLVVSICISTKLANRLPNRKFPALQSQNQIYPYRGVFFFVRHGLHPYPNRQRERDRDTIVLNGWSLLLPVWLCLPTIRMEMRALTHKKYSSTYQSVTYVELI